MTVMPRKGRAPVARSDPGIAPDVPGVSDWIGIFFMALCGRASLPMTPLLIAEY